MSACGYANEKGPPYSPEEALSTFQIEEGFRIELFASEPLVADPVAMDIGENGRVFVVEMPGYPLDTSPSGRVKLLEDTDGDGYPDRSAVFVDGLVLPTGVMRWKRGILVTAAPHVWYFEDTDGDGQADEKQIVLKGFPFSNPQHTVSDPIYGLDNWIYLANEPAVRAVIYPDEFGDRGEAIHFPDRPDAPRLENNGTNVRFRPDTYQLEALSSRSQFGQTFDEWGRHFLVGNSNHARHEVMAARYLKRNPHLLVRSTIQDLSDHGDAAKVFPITERPQHQMLTDVGQITSGCGLVVYLGGAFPETTGRTSFVAEPVHNLVHQDLWSDAGSTFVLRRAQETREFLASTDSWFRPVFLYVGPDGALYLLDYYRRVIEHPEWMSEEVSGGDDLYDGNDRGRIYRIIPDDASFPPPPFNLNLSDASAEELVPQLANPSVWWRRTVQRLLVDRRAVEAVPHLVAFFKNTQSGVGRVHALWTLEGLGELDAVLIEAALNDLEAGVRENAVRLAERRLEPPGTRGNSPSVSTLTQQLLRMADDLSPRVRFQLLCTLGDLSTPEAPSLREKLLFQDFADPWVQIAALSAAAGEALPMLKQAISRVPMQETEASARFLEQASSVVAARGRHAEIQEVIRISAAGATDESAWWRAAGLRGLAAGLKQGTLGRPAGSPLLKLVQSPSTALRRAALSLLSKTSGIEQLPQSTVQWATRTAADSNADAGLRADAVRLLALARPGHQETLLESLIDSRLPQEVQVAAVDAIGQIPGARIGKLLLERWRGLRPEVRSAAAEALLADPERVELLVEAIEQGEVRSWMFEFRHRGSLIMHRDPEIRARVRPFLTGGAEERQHVLERYQQALDLSGDPARGKQVFEKTCERCHSYGDSKAQFGPDLTTVRHQPAEMLLAEIIVPSRSIAQNYEFYVVHLKSGRILEGIISDETLTSITVINEEGKKESLPRAEVARISMSEMSAMPDNLELEIDVRQMADLLAFLKRGE